MNLRALLLLAAAVALGCEQLRTNNAGMLTTEDAGCPYTWAEASAQCDGSAAPRPCPTAGCVYVEMGDCPRLDQLCTDAVASCDGARWTCAR